MTVYCVWCWDNYYPLGENGNLRGIYSSREAAEARANFLEKTEFRVDNVSITMEYIDSVSEDANTY